jgi:hypothetical protein
MHRRESLSNDQRRALLAAVDILIDLLDYLYRAKPSLASPSATAVLPVLSLMLISPGIQCTLF